MRHSTLTEEPRTDPRRGVQGAGAWVGPRTWEQSTRLRCPSQFRSSDTPDVVYTRADWADDSEYRGHDGVRDSTPCSPTPSTTSPGRSERFVPWRIGSGSPTRAMLSDMASACHSRGVGAGTTPTRSPRTCMRGLPTDLHHRVGLENLASPPLRAVAGARAGGSASRGQSAQPPRQCQNAVEWTGRAGRRTVARGLPHDGSFRCHRSFGHETPGPEETDPGARVLTAAMPLGAGRVLEGAEAEEAAPSKRRLNEHG